LPAPPALREPPVLLAPPALREPPALLAPPVLREPPALLAPAVLDEPPALLAPPVLREPPVLVTPPPALEPASAGGPSPLPLVSHAEKAQAAVNKHPASTQELARRTCRGNAVIPFQSIGTARSDHANSNPLARAK
jgi:hypothetical protein